MSIMLIIVLFKWAQFALKVYIWSVRIGYDIKLCTVLKLLNDYTQFIVFSSDLNIIYIYIYPVFLNIE